MRTLLLCLALAAMAAQGQEQKDLEAIWQMERLADQVAGRLTINTFTVFSGNDVVRIIFGTDTAYGRGGANALGAIIDRHNIRRWDAYAKECCADSLRREVLDSVQTEYGTAYKWRYRQPTFPGFIQWLRPE